MERFDKVGLGLAFVALAAIVVFQRPIRNALAEPLASDPVPENISLTPENANFASGPAYLMYNTPWAFSPPVGNFLPKTTVGQIGQQISEPMRIGECGCA